MIYIAPAAQKQFESLPLMIQARMEALFERLKRWPDVSGVKPLRGKLAGHYRMRTGDYRLQFKVVGANIYIEQVGHRDGFYD